LETEKSASWALWGREDEDELPLDDDAAAAAAAAADDDEGVFFVVVEGTTAFLGVPRDLLGVASCLFCCCD